MSDPPKKSEDKIQGSNTNPHKPADAEQLAAIRQLVVTLSHGINNPLAGILGAIEVLLNNTQGIPAEMKEVLVSIKQEAEKIRNVMNQLKELKVLHTTSYLKNNVKDIKMIDLNTSKD